MEDKISQLLHPNISSHILHTVLHIFPKVPTRRIFLTSKSFSWWSFPLFSWTIMWFRRDTVRRNKMRLILRGQGLICLFTTWIMTNYCLLIQETILFLRKSRIRNVLRFESVLLKFHRSVRRLLCVRRGSIRVPSVSQTWHHHQGVQMQPNV